MLLVPESVKIPEPFIVKLGVPVVIVMLLTTLMLPEPLKVTLFEPRFKLLTLGLLLKLNTVHADPIVLGDCYPMLLFNVSVLEVVVPAS